MEKGGLAELRGRLLAGLHGRVLERFLFPESNFPTPASPCILGVATRSSG